MPLYVQNGNLLNKAGTLGTSAGCCCYPPPPPPDPCAVLVDGEWVPLSSFNPYEVLTATWRGLHVPGRSRAYVNGVLVSDIPSRSSDEVVYVTDGGCDAPTYADEGKGVRFATDSPGYINACVTNEALGKYDTFRAEQTNATTCRLYGGIGTSKILNPCLIDGAPSGDSVTEETWWLWECLVVNGVPGGVTVSPIIGFTSLNGTAACVNSHEAPVVTLDFIP